jgi:tetratricopeptide (TPR) repeat protein
MFRCSRCWKEFEPDQRSNPIVCPYCGNKTSRRGLKTAGPLAPRFKEGNKKALFNRGVANQEKKLYGVALNYYDDVLKIDPYHTGAWLNKGFIKIKLNCYEEAEKFFNEVLKIDPNDKDAWYNKGIVLGKLENFEKALVCCDKVLSIDPKDKDAQHNKDVILLRIWLREEAKKGKYDSIEWKEFKEARSRGPE